MICLRTFAALVTAATLALAVPTATPRPVTVREVASFPLGSFIENIAVRASGDLLITRQDSPELFSVSPFTGVAKSVAVIPEAQICLGIAEVDPDVFAVVAGNGSVGAAQPGSFSVWTVDLRCHPPALHRAAAIPESLLLNGVTKFPTRGEPTVLVAESFGGVVYKVGLRSGNYSVVLSGPEYAVINGIRLGKAKPSGPVPLYYTNTAAGNFSRVDLSKDATAASTPVVVASGLEVPDDFALSPDGRSAFIAVNVIRSVVKIDLATGARTQIAGGPNSTDFASVASVAFGRTRVDKNVLYAVTGGERGSPPSTANSPAKILAIYGAV